MFIERVFKDIHALSGFALAALDRAPSRIAAPHLAGSNVRPSIASAFMQPGSLHFSRDAKWLLGREGLKERDSNLF
jgi:hypothetical protein